jgi:hypothetical protein
MKKFILNCRNKIMFVYITLFTFSSPAWADLPSPPAGDMATSSQDWSDVGGAMLYKLIGIACVALGAVIVLAVAGGILKAYHTAHEKGDLGHFFKMLFVGLLVAAIGLGLDYSAYQIVKVH